MDVPLECFRKLCQYVWNQYCAYGEPYDTNIYKPSADGEFHFKIEKATFVIKGMPKLYSELEIYIFTSKVSVFHFNPSYCKICKESIQHF